MAPAQWNLVKSIFAAALKVEPGGRAAFLNRECAESPDLRSEVESLLEAHHGAGAFLDEPAFAIDPPTLPRTEADHLAPGARLGVYTVLQKIDEGGMAVVYQGFRDDSEFRKLVAIKVLKPGMDTHFILERFHNEKQILAHFDHANIAKVLDSGSTPGGRPYFVLEFIAGQPIDVFCQEGRLSLEERLKLFQRVCAAVEYAHQNLIVHRDLKPRNILVTPEGEPKLLDFGIAKILSDERELTIAGVRPMTPDYASPEQIRGEPITTATDIYGLGVILYELLTSCRPFRTAGRPSTDQARQIPETLPTRPSTLLRRPGENESAPCDAAQLDHWARRLKGDLDNIVLKAMHPDAKRRYRSVGELSVDIDRYFLGDPVLATGDDWGYRTRKFIKRHRPGVIAGVAVFISLSAGLLAVQREIVVARHERAVADQRASQIRSLANSLIFDLHDAIQNLPGSTPVRAKLMNRATEALDSIRGGAENDPALQRELATAYERLADVQGSPQDFNLGDLTAALRNYRKALALLEQLRRASPRDLSIWRSMAQVEWPMSAILERQGDAQEAATLAQKALDLREALAQAEPLRLEARKDLATAYYLRANSAVQAGDLGTARSAREKSLQLWESIAAENAGDVKAKYQIALAAKNLAAVEQRFQDLTSARKHLEQARAIDEERCLAAPRDATAKLDLSFDLSELAELEVKTGNLAAAADLYRRARTIREDLLARDAGNHRLRDRAGYIRSREGRVQLRLRHFPDALTAFRRALELRRDLATDRSNLEAQFSLAESQADMGTWQCATKDKSSGRFVLAAALTRMAELNLQHPLDIEQRETVAEFRQQLEACSH